MLLMIKGKKQFQVSFEILSNLILLHLKCFLEGKAFRPLVLYFISDIFALKKGKK